MCIPFKEAPEPRDPTILEVATEGTLPAATIEDTEVLTAGTTGGGPIGLPEGLGPTEGLILMSGRCQLGEPIPTHTPEL